LSKLVKYSWSYGPNEVCDKVNLRRQETEEKGVQCFRCWEIEHYKWECSNIKVEKERRSSEEAVYMVSLQNAQQEERPVHSL